MGLQRSLLLSILVLTLTCGILAAGLEISFERLKAQAKGLIGQQTLPSQNRIKRDTSSSSWSVPEEVYQISLNVPEDCSQVNPLPEFPNATCFSHCKTSSCDSDGIDSVQSGESELVCTARLFQLGFQRSGTGEISRWIKRHPAIAARYADIFIDRRKQPILDICPAEQLLDTTAAGYFAPYPLSSIGNNQQVYYIHCEHCLTTTHVDYYFGKLFLDLPTAMFPLISSSNQKFIITIKNPTDRAIAEYFYPYQKDGTDLTTVGGTTYHNVMIAAIAQAKDCMILHGPTACVYGHNTVYRAPVLAEAQMLYDSCYSTHLTQVLKQINRAQTYFIKIEEHTKSSDTAMLEVYNFVGVDYAEPQPTPPPTVPPPRKPLLKETITMMDQFFAPFNRELRDMLGDDKWLYIR